MIDVYIAEKISILRAMAYFIDRNSDYVEKLLEEDVKQCIDSFDFAKLRALVDMLRVQDIGEMSTRELKELAQRYGILNWSRLDKSSLVMEVFYARQAEEKAAVQSHTETTHEESSSGDRNDRTDGNEDAGDSSSERRRRTKSSAKPRKARRND